MREDVEALAQIIDALSELDGETQGRVLNTAEQWLNPSNRSAPAPKQSKPKNTAANGQVRLSDRVFDWLKGQTEPKTLLDISEAVSGSTRGSIYQTIRKDDRFKQASKGEWVTI